MKEFFCPRDGKLSILPPRLLVIHGPDRPATVEKKRTQLLNWFSTGERFAKRDAILLYFTISPKGVYILDIMMKWEVVSTFWFRYHGLYKYTGPCYYIFLKVHLIPNFIFRTEFEQLSLALSEINLVLAAGGARAALGTFLLFSGPFRIALILLGFHRFLGVP